MATDTKRLKSRIRSIDSTLHLAKAMELVASTKIRGASEIMNKNRQYTLTIEDMIKGLAGVPECKKSVYMQKNNGGKVCTVVIAGDRGLAGGYNMNVFKLADSILADEIVPIGKRACEKYQRDILKVEDFDYKEAYKLAKELCDGFKSGKYEKIQIVSTQYVSMMTQNPEAQQILPVEMSEDKKNVSIIYEPDEITVLDALVEKYVAAKLLVAARESFVCELVARRLAMDSASKNASEMIDSLTLEYNRARQGAITQEITEIIAGSGI